MPQNPSFSSATEPALTTNVPDENTRYPCGTCDESVTWSQRGVVCETCGQWFHLGCQDLDLNSREYENLDSSDISWNCVICANANYSSTAFDLFGIDNTEVSNEISLCSINSDSKFNPLHSSTPSRSSRQDKHTRRPLRFVNVNCQSIVGKTAELANLAHSLKPDIIFGTESWLASKHHNAEIFPKGYSIYRKDRPDHTHGGGIFLAVSEDLTSSVEPELLTECEIVWTKVKLKGRRTLLISCFYHPHTHMKNSIDNFLESARRATLSENAIIVIAGDFNLPGWDWCTKLLKPTQYPAIHHKFREGIEDLGLEVVNQEPTRGENFLDLFLTNQPSLVTRTENLPGLADHDAVYIEFQINPPKRRQPKRQIPLYTEECIVPLKAAAAELNAQIIGKYSIDSEIEAVWSEFKDGLLQACAEHVPHRTTKSKSSLPWLDYNTKKLVIRRDRIHKKNGKRQEEKTLKNFLKS